jgi:hypothetical protein
MKSDNTINYSLEIIMEKFKRKYHSDPLIKCFENESYAGNDTYFKLQLLHLVSDENDIAPLEQVMASFAATFVSNPEHLLAMDTTKDYRGDFWTPQEFNRDAYEIGKLFHRKSIDPKIFLPFVKKSVIFKKKDMLRMESMSGNSLREYAMRRVLKSKIYSDIAEKLGVPVDSIDTAMANSPDLMCGASILSKIKSLTFQKHLFGIMRAVAVSQDWKLLETAIRKSPRHKLQFMRSFIMGKNMDCGQEPLEYLRAVNKWG